MTPKYRAFVSVTHALGGSSVALVHIFLPNCTFLFSFPLLLYSFVLTDQQPITHFFGFRFAFWFRLRVLCCWSSCFT
ncbi:unnamed protein product [Dicrocoelium dendriticum]|nr:unnamed protein product [Dicrocoelium dendriticum]